MAIDVPGAEMIAFFDVLEAGIVTIAAEAEREITDDVLLQAEGLLEAVTVLSDHIPNGDGQILVSAIANIYLWLEDSKILHQPRKGRPQIEISEHQLEALLSFHFSSATIAGMLQVSVSTVRRRILQYGLEQMTEYTDLTDNELDEITAEFVHNSPNGGQKSYEGYLRGMGIHVRRSCIRSTLLRVDPAGVRRRFRQVLHRREYSVPMPNSLWHIDGHHKLIRWRIVVHGGIDGFSRLPVFLKVSSNNSSETVLKCFLEAVSAFGLPSRVRCDKGGENVKVSEFMLSHPERGPGRGSCITGRSVHNQRIERLWRDVFSGCISLFYHLFYSLEDAGILDPSNDADLFALHYVYLPRLQHQLNTFRESYSQHRIRGQRNRSPYQLWIEGMANLNSDESAIIGAMEDSFTVI